MSEAQEPAWKAEKALLDSLDDGHGPYLEWIFSDSVAKAHHERLWEEFKLWAADNLGQGYSLSCVDGHMLDDVTHWAFKGFLAGAGDLLEPLLVKDQATLLGISALELIKALKEEGFGDYSVNMALKKRAASAMWAKFRKS